ncbi:MAG TPA: hypothetical protein VGF94_16200 [Kofleriaceae bacterium]|jgi:hypothetical protein
MMMRTLLVSLAVARIAAAQPAPPQPQPQGDRVDAKALMQSGVKLFDAHDYLGALAIFKDAYQRFPSAKILINIGTTLKQLDRKADAANTYERYLASPDTDPATRMQVEAAIAELGKDVGRIAVTVTPVGAQLEVGDEWLPADRVHVLFVAPGTATVRARRDGFQPAEKPIAVAAGGQASVALDLVAIPKPVVKPLIVTVHDDVPALEQANEPRARLGAFVMAHVSVTPRVGSAWLVGGTFDATEQLAIDAALLLGPGLVSSGDMDYPSPPPKLGGYAGASFTFLAGQLRPRVSAGMPIFASDGARFSVRAAGGIEYVANRHLSITVELGLEENLNPPDDIRELAFVPALAAVGRL